MSFPRKQHDMTLNMSFTVKNIPSPDNGQVGIVEASIAYDNVCISDFGIANADSANSNRPEDILNRAREQAKQKLLQRESPSYSAPAQRQSFPKDGPPVKTKANGGGTKPASERQISMIEKMCHERRLDPYELSQQLCNRSFDNLLGQDADIIIKKLKGM